MRKLLLVLAIGVILIGACAAPSTSSEETPAPTTPASAPVTKPMSGPSPMINTGTIGIDLALTDFVKAYETKDIDLLKRCLAEESSFYSELVINAQNIFARHERIEMKFSDPIVNLYDDGKRTTVCLNETFKGIDRDGITTEEIVSGDIFELIKTTADWKIVSWYRDIYMSEIPGGEEQKE